MLAVWEVVGGKDLEQGKLVQCIMRGFLLKEWLVFGQAWEKNLANLF